MLNVLITGANGFVGRALCAHLVAHGVQVYAAVRQQSSVAQISGVHYRFIADINATTDWSEALQGMDVIVHLAARVHVMQETAVDPLAAFRTVNVEGSRNLAQQAAKTGVKRLVFLSSIKVLGESSGQQPLNADSIVSPMEPYACSKWEAEQVLRSVAQATGMELVVLRPPLIYGAGVQGNFLRLWRLIQMNIPLPLGSVQNRRTLLYVENCCALIRVALEHPAAVGQDLLMGDNEAVSTPQLLQYLAEASGCRLLLLPVPVWLLKTLARLLGKQAEIERLTDSMVVDISRTCELLHCQPPISSRQGIAQTVRTFLGSE